MTLAPYLAKAAPPASDVFVAPLAQPLPMSARFQLTQFPFYQTADPRESQLASRPQRGFRGRIISAGRIRNALGEPGMLTINAEAIQEAIDQGLFEGLACFVDHPGPFEHGSLRNLFGSWHSVTWNEDTRSADGVLGYYTNSETEPVAQRLQQILKDAEAGQPIPDIGVSLVFYAVFAPVPEGDADGRDGTVWTVTRFRKIESADLVFSPAADGRILQVLSTPRTVVPFSQLREAQTAQHGGNPMAINNPSAAQPQPAPSAEGEALQTQSQRATRNANTETAGEHIHQAGANRRSQPPPEAVHVLHQGPELSPADLDRLAAVVAQAAENAVQRRLAPLVEENVVQLGGPPPRQRVTGMRHASEDVTEAVGWLFGAPDSRTPEPRLRNSAELYRLLTGDIHWRGIFDPAEALATANVTTLSDLAVNAMNKVIVATWDTLASYRWYELVTVVQPNDGSLQDMAWISFGGIANLPVVAEGAAYTEATVADTREADSFVKYGAYVGITRKMLRNSEIARIQAVPKALAVAAVRTREAKIAGIFTSNSGAGPTLDDDSVALFHTASHANLLTTAFSYAAWSAARLECYKLTEAGSSKRLGFWPKFWLGPADLYDSALEIFGYGAGPGGKPGTGDNNVNPFGESRPGDPRPVPLAVPSFTDANDWAYLVDPNIQPVIQMSYSQNPGGSTHPMPELFSVVNETAGLMFTNDTMPIKVRDEFAYGVSTYRGIGKRNVT